MTEFLSRLLPLGLLLLALAACETEPETYPITGEPCSPDDPVQETDVIRCAPA